MSVPTNIGAPNGDVTGSAAESPLPRLRARGAGAPPPPPRRTIVLEAALVALLSVACAAWTLRLWRADLAIPLRYSPVDDTKFYLMLVKGIVDHGSYLSNHALGVPFAQHLSDYPQGADNLSLLMIRVLAVFSSNPAVVVNLFYLLTFALAAFTSHLVLRSLGLGALAAGLASLLFSLLSYHFFRGESHLLLSAYYGVPLSAYLFLRLLEGAPLSGARQGARPGLRRLPRAELVLTVCISLVIGSDNLYYAVFSVAMLCAAVVLALTKRDGATVRRGLLVVTLIAATVAVNVSPSLLYRAEHGPNPALERSAAFTEGSEEAFSLRLANLLLPAPEGHIAALRHVAAQYDHEIAPGYCEACYGSLGSVGTAGFLWLLIGLLGALAGGAGYVARHRLLRNAGVGVLIALAFGAIGGLGSLLQVFVTPDVRAWNRISVFIAFLSLLAAGVLLERFAQWLRRFSSGRALGLAAFAAALVLGIYDQTSDSFIPSYAATARSWRADARFVSQIERRLGPGAAVFQLPYVPFPEGYPETPVGDEVATYATKYQPLRAYLHSSTLRWSYGSVKGRPDDWSAALAGQPLSYVLDAAVAAGFEGLWVDSSGFEPEKVRAIRAELARALDPRPLVDASGELLFYDLRPYRARLLREHGVVALGALRRDTLAPLRTTCASGALELYNPSRRARRALLTAHMARALSSAPLQPPPDGQASDLSAASTVTVQRELNLAPGRTDVDLAAASRSLGGTSQVLFATVTDAELAPFSVSPSGPPSTIPGLTGPPCAP